MRGMNLKPLLLVGFAALLTAPLVQAQAPAPAATDTAATPAPVKHRAHKKAAEQPVAPAATPAPATPAPSGLGGLFSRKTAATPAPAAAPSTTAKPNPAPVPASTPAATPVAKKAGPPKMDPNATPAPGGGSGMVWVNTRDKVYHKEGSRWYGKTKQGKYLSEQDAIKEGDHAAGHGE